MDIIKEKILLVGSVLTMLAAGFFIIGPVAPDDAYITYWASYSLLEYGSILNYNLNYVEQSSSLLQVLLIYAASLTSGLDVVYLGQISSIIFGVVCIIGVYLIEKDLGLKSFYGTYLTAFQPILCYWSFGGLETTLVASCMLLWVYSSYKYLGTEGNYLYLLVTSTILLSSVRPEMVIFLICVGIYFLLGTALVEEKRKLAIFALCIITASVIPTLFRLLYFESLFPQPVYAKKGSEVLGGVKYAITYLIGYNVFSKLNLLGFSSFSIVAASWFVSLFISLYKNIFLKINYATYVISISLVVYMLFIVLSGADWMPARRFIVHILPVASILLSVVLNRCNYKIYKKIAFTIVLSMTLISWINVDSSSWRGVAYWDRQEHLEESQSQHPDLADRMWFERNSRKFIRKYTKYNMIVENLNSGLPNILVSEAGIPLFYLSRYQRDQIGSLADMHGLFHRKFSSCSDIDIQSNHFGMMVSREYVMSNSDMLKRKCDIPVFQMVSFMTQDNKALKSLLESGEYRLVTEADSQESLLVRE